jgi:hypothetical protein
MEHQCHALIEAWLPAAHRLTNQGDGREGARRDWSAGSSQVLRQVTVGRVSGVQRRGESAFAADEVRERSIQPICSTEIHSVWFRKDISLAL